MSRAGDGVRRTAAGVALALAVRGTVVAASLLTAGPARAEGDPLPAGKPPAAAPATPPPPSSSETHGEGMRAYHAALAVRHLGAMETLTLDDLRARLAEAEDLAQEGRNDEAVARLAALVEAPAFEPFESGEEGRAARTLLGQTLASAGAYAPARAYLREVIAAPGAWAGNATYARRAARRLADVALETERYDLGVSDLAAVPASAPEETRGEVLYTTGRAREAAGAREEAMAAYEQVTPRSRFWSQATYLRGLLEVERGRLAQAEALFCKVADPKRQEKTAPVFADEHFFAVRDLARLALGRVAHEVGRFDDARYYYYLVPRDSDRLAEALYEAATTRYERKDYDGARELLGELSGLGIHHRYEDEAWILDAYVDLAQCKFPEADRKLSTFLARYQPVRDAARKIAADPRATEALLAAARRGADASGAVLGVSPDLLRSVAALVRLDPAYARASLRRAVAEHEASGLTLALATLRSTSASLGTNGGVVASLPAAGEGPDPAARAAQLEEARASVAAARRDLDDAREQNLAAGTLGPLVEAANALDLRLTALSASPAASMEFAANEAKDLPALLTRDARQAAALGGALKGALSTLGTLERALAVDALKRLDLRLSRLLRRARLGRIESVLGRKRALEVEVEGIAAGIVPEDAIDSLDAARYLQDREEYWPFEGDDWPDEFVGGEQK